MFKGRKNDNNQKEVKINIGSEEEPPSLVSASEDMKTKDIVNALRLIAANQEILLSKWQQIHDI